MELVKLAIVFIVILILFKFKLGIGISIFLGGILLGIIFNQTIKELFFSVIDGIISWRTIRLVLIVSIISTLGAALKNLRLTDKLVIGIENLFQSVKVTIILLPALIGLMPMPGGALLSAPMVASASVNYKIKPERQAAVNYWFRHILEFCWPVYPGIILASVILKVEITQISFWQMPFSAAMILGGFLFLILPIKKTGKIERTQSVGQSWIGIISGVWPIFMVVIITLITKLDILYSLLITIVLFGLINRPNLEICLKSLKKGASFPIISLIVGVMVFQGIINDSGAAVQLANQIGSWGVPDWLVISLSCFIIGVLTGIVTGYVGVVYPILITLLVTPEPHFNLIALAYGSGLIGVMVSPLHLCLVLTNQYFRVKFGQVYPLILGPALFVGIAMAIILYFGYAS